MNFFSPKLRKLKKEITDNLKIIQKINRKLVDEK